MQKKRALNTPEARGESAPGDFGGLVVGFGPQVCFLGDFGMTKPGRVGVQALCCLICAAC